MSRRLWFTMLVLTGVAAAATPALPRAQAPTADDMRRTLCASDRRGRRARQGDVAPFDGHRHGVHAGR